MPIEIPESQIRVLSANTCARHGNMPGIPHAKQLKTVRMGSAEKLISVKGLGALQIHIVSPDSACGMLPPSLIFVWRRCSGGEDRSGSGNPKEFIVV